MHLKEQTLPPVFSAGKERTSPAGSPDWWDSLWDLSQARLAPGHKAALGSKLGSRLAGLLPEAWISVAAAGSWMSRTGPGSQGCFRIVSGQLGCLGELCLLLGAPKGTTDSGLAVEWSWSQVTGLLQYLWWAVGLSTCKRVKLDPYLYHTQKST